MTVEQREINEQNVMLLKENIGECKRYLRYVKSVKERFLSDGSTQQTIPMRVIEMYANDNIQLGMVFRSACNVERELEQLEADLQGLVETMDNGVYNLQVEIARGLLRESRGKIKGKAKQVSKEDVLSLLKESTKNVK